MGVNRDLKKATEAYWGGKLSRDDLLNAGKRLRLEHWNIQKKAGIDVIPSNDFSFYDHVLDHIQLFGVSLLQKNLVRGITHMDLDRLSLSGTPGTSCLPLTSSSPWAEGYKGQLRMERTRSTFPAW